MERAVLLIGHGSKITGSSKALDQVLRALRAKESDTLFQAAFLELQSPSIPQAIEFCVSQGVEEIILIPYFVQMGRHVVQDIPQIVSEAKARYPQKHIRLAEYLGFD